MKMEFEDLPVGVTKIVLSGDLDAKGSNEIDLQFQAIASSRPKVVVDLSQVGFLASIGIRTLMLAAKANGRKGGKLVLLDPAEPVHKVLTTCGADSVLAIVHGFDVAVAAVA
jgi:anti-anti-sigma factor